jgi:hypothetical protein
VGSLMGLKERLLGFSASIKRDKHSSLLRYGINYGHKMHELLYFQAFKSGN